MLRYKSLLIIALLVLKAPFVFGQVNPDLEKALRENPEQVQDVFVEFHSPLNLDS
jgi:hypothetical protein